MTREPSIIQQHTQCVIDLHNERMSDDPNERFRALLDAAGWTPVEFAGRFGVNGRSARGWVSGRREPPPAAIDYLERVVTAVENVCVPEPPALD